IGGRQAVQPGGGPHFGPYQVVLRLWVPLDQTGTGNDRPIKRRLQQGAFIAEIEAWLASRIDALRELNGKVSRRTAPLVVGIPRIDVGDDRDVAGRLSRG